MVSPTQEDEDRLRQRLAELENNLGAEHPGTLDCVTDLAIQLTYTGDYSGAAVLHRRALAGREMVLGPDHHDTLNSMGYLANMLEMMGDYAAAEIHYRHELAGREKTMGSNHLLTRVKRRDFNRFLKSKGDPRQASSR